MNINPIYKNFITDKSTITLLFGGRGSGKSWVAAQKTLIRLMSEVPHRMLAIHKFERKLKATVYQQLKDVIIHEGLEDEFTFRTSPPEIIYKGNGNNIIFFGLDGGKIKSITGITSVWVEEATFITEEDFQELFLSIRGKHKNYVQFILTFNPIDIRHWINKRFFIEKRYDFSSYHTTYKDNTFVNIDEYEKKLEAYKHDEAYYKMAALGEWMVQSQKLVFNNWCVYDENKHKSISSDIYHYEYNITGGLDWGATHASVCLIVGKTENELIVLDEVYGRGWTNDEFLNNIKAKKYPNYIVLKADSAEPARIKEFKEQGFNIEAVKKGKGSVQYAFDYLKRHKIIVMPHCTNTISELTSYSYEYDEINDIIYNTPDPKQPDDCVAALRYSVNNMWRRTDNLLEAVPSIY